MIIKIADKTLREKSKVGASSLSFKEKIDIAKQLDNLKVDIIETSEIINGKKDILYLHTISSVVKNSIISCPVGISEKEVEVAYDAIKTAAKPRLNILVPVSTVQMEYLCHKKPDKMLDAVVSVTKYASSVCKDIEVSFVDSTRAEKEFLYKAVKVAVENGAKTVTLCDSAGIMLPGEFEKYILDIYENVPELKNVVLSVECSDEMNMGTASAIASVNVGARQIKVATGVLNCPTLKSVLNVFRVKKNVLDIETSMNMAVLDNVAERISLIAEGGFSRFGASTDEGEKSYSENVKFSADDDMHTIGKAIFDLGYELSDEEIKDIYDDFLKIAAKKAVGLKELEAIVASTAMQVTPTFKIKSYVINSGNVITPTANIELVRNDEVLRGISIGDGSIDAAFRAIEQIIGHHYELDDFQIQSVTRGREAMGESLVKLRSEGKLYSGKGTSTDIVEASINAYINAINKIYYEEEF